MQITTASIIMFIILSIAYCYISYKSGKKKGYTDGYIQGQCDCLVNVVNTIDECFQVYPKDEEKN